MQAVEQRGQPIGGFRAEGFRAENDGCDFQQFTVREGVHGGFTREVEKIADPSHGMLQEPRDFTPNRPVELLEPITLRQ